MFCLPKTAWPPTSGGRHRAGRSGTVRQLMQRGLSSCFRDQGKVRDGHPRPFFPRFYAFFCQLDAFGAFPQCPGEGFIFDDVSQEEFPLDLEGVLVCWLARDGDPIVEVVERAVDIGIPDWPRGGFVRLDPALAQAGDGGPARAVDLHCEKVVAADTNCP